MTDAPRGALYTRDLLALAVSLSDYPLDPTLPLKGEARSTTCGSTVMLTCSENENGQIEEVGLRASACAVGQASAAVFAKAAAGRTRDDLASARQAIAAWLSGDNAMPEWAGIEVLEKARAYPARHGAVLLAWDAALAALSNKGTPR